MASPSGTGGTAGRCNYRIEVEWPGHRAVLSRRQCRNRVKPPHTYCHVHRWKEREFNEYGI